MKRAFPGKRWAEAGRRPASWSRLELAALSALTLVGAVLRFWSYTAAPGVHDNPDEAQFAWLGISLIRDHLPTTWSAFPEYPNPVVLVTPDGIHWPLVHPWFDHPPLFGLLIGGAAWVAGIHGFVDDAAWIDRLPVVLLGIATVPLAYLLGRRVLGVAPALVGTALFATAPGAVLFSRSVEIEAVLAPLLLLALYLTHRLLGGEGGTALAGLVAASLLAGAFKVDGLVVGLTCAVVLAAFRLWQPAVVAAGSAMVGLATYFAWGAYWDWSLFWSILLRQGAARAGLLNGFLFITAPSGLDRLFHDGWWLLGWVGLGALLLAPSRSARQWLLAWPVAAYLAAMLVLTDQRVTAFGWYRIPVYPLVYLAAGWLLWQAWRRPTAANLTVALALGGAAAAYPLLGGAGAGSWAALVLAAGIAAVVLWPARGRWVLAALGGLVLLGNAATDVMLPSIYLKL